MSNRELEEQSSSLAQNGERKNWPVLLNPLMLYLGFAGYQMVLMPIAFFVLVPEIVDVNFYFETFLVWCLFLAGVGLGWRVSGYLGQRVFNFLASMLTLGTDKQMLPSHLLKGGVTTLVVLSGVCFCLLMATSGAGFLWITDSRTAYINNKTGVGVLWILTYSCLALAYIFALFLNSNPASVTMSTLRSHIWAMLKLLIPYCAVVYFLGSKQLIISLGVIGLVFFNYVLYPVQPRVFFFLVTLGLLVILALQIVQGTAKSLADAIIYGDYFQNTSKFLQRFDEFGGYKYGGIAISNLWSYIPRALYPDKPNAYGSLLVDQIIYPGSADAKYFPGMAPWVGDYLDAGIVGTALSGVETGLFMGWAHNYYRKHSNNVIRFIVLLQIGFGLLFPFVPMPAFTLLFLPLFCLVLKVASAYAAKADTIQSHSANGI